MPLPLRPLLVLAFATQATHAQSQPDSGSLLRQQEQNQVRAPLVLPEAEAERDPLQATTGLTVGVTSVRFSGATDLIPPAELQELVADALGKQLDFAALQELAERVTRSLKQHGWFLGRAYLPKQDVTEGEVEIVLLAGRLSPHDPVRITPSGTPPLRIDPGRLKAMADHHLQPAAVAQQDALNRAVLLMNDLSGVRVQAQLEAGDSPDSTRINLIFEELPLLTPSVSVDSHGNRDTGVEQLNLSLNLNAPLGQGDLLTTGLTQTEGLEMARLSYARPLGYDGLKLNLGTHTLDYKLITPSGQRAGLGGSSHSGNLGLIYPWLRSRTANHSVALTYTDKKITDRASTGLIRDKSLQSTGLTLSGDFLDRWGGGGASNWSVSATQGVLRLNLFADAAADATSFRTAGGYDKLNLAFSRLQKLSGAWTLHTSLSGQLAGKNLDSSEKFIAGGPNGVRAYPGSEGSADEGVLANLELRYDWPDSLSTGKLQLQAFYDSAQVRLHKDLHGQPISNASGNNHYALEGMGLGATLSQPGSYYLRAIWATRLGSNPGRSVQDMDADGLNNSRRLWLQGQWWF